MVERTSPVSIGSGLGRDGPRPLLVVSPHLDDAVLSLRRTLREHPGSCVVTMLAGTPDDSLALQEWDRRGGHASGAAAMRTRRLEDETALAALGVRLRHLHFLDGQYLTGDLERPQREIVAALVDLLIENTCSALLCGPVGIHHADHVRISNAFLEAADWVGVAELYLYEEIPYRARLADTRERIAKFEHAGWECNIDRRPCPPHDPITDAALFAYASQLPMLDAWDLDHDECIWHLTRPT